MILHKKDYSGESLSDLERDVNECFDGDFNPPSLEIPKDQYGFHKGTFRVTVEWIPEESKGWICPKCNADRTKIACPLGVGATIDGRCPMTVEAQ